MDPLPPFPVLSPLFEVSLLSCFLWFGGGPPPAPPRVSQAVQGPAWTMGSLPPGPVTLGCSGLEIGGEPRPALDWVF